MISTESQVTIERSTSAKLRVGVLAISMDPASRATLEVMVAQTPGAHLVDNVDRHIVPREVMRMLEDFQYRVCVIDFDEGVEQSCRIAEHLRDNCDNTVSLVAACSDTAQTPSSPPCDPVAPSIWSSRSIPSGFRGRWRTLSGGGTFETMMRPRDGS